MPKPPKKPKVDKLLPGLRKLCDRQPPGHVYTTEEIAAECGCTPQRIGQIADAALERVRRKLRHVAREYDLPEKPKAVKGAA